MSQRQQLERIMEIDRQVRAGLYPNANRLARDLGVSRRVIFKDRAFMIERLGAPLATDRERGGWYYTEPAYALPNIMITEGELIAFFLSAELARHYVGTAFQKPLESAVAALAQAMPRQISVDLEALRQHASFASPPALQANPQRLLLIYEAIRERRLLWLRYHANTTGQESERRVEPYHLHNDKGEWYLLAYDLGRGDRRTFHVGRILDCRKLPDKFVPRSSVLVEEWLRTAFGAEGGEEPAEVVVRFDAYQARWVRERQFHPSQQLEEQADGGVILRMQTSGLGEVRRWVMQYGGHAEVLAPAALRQAVIEEVRRMAEVYGAR
jgi:predicted DNA-binding transcriptional regulator YafY